MDQNQVWEAVRANYYRDWVNTEPDAWALIKARLDCLQDVRASLTKIANSGDIDNARRSGAK